MLSSARVSTSLKVAVLIVAIAAIAGSSLFWSASRSDRLVVAQQAEFVAHLLEDQVAGIAYDQESVAIWDDTIQYTRFAFDREWIDSNIGVWMYEYFGHDRTFILNETDQPIYGMTDGEQFGTDGFALLGDDVASLLEQTRAGIDNGDVALFHDGLADNPRSIDVGEVEGRPAIISAMAIVSDTGELFEPGQAQYVLLSVRFLDQSFLADLAEHYLIEGPRFSWSDDAVGDEVSTPLYTTTESLLGFVAWRTKRPGASLLADTWPVLTAALLLLGMIIAALTRRLTRTYDQIKRNEAEALHRASHDQLTSLPNRFQFRKALETAVASAAKAHRPLAVLIVDLDGFKSINDALGHPAGDDVIRVVAERLQAVAGPTDLVVRMGGDEFAILRTDGTSKDAVERICERAISSIGTPVPTDAGHAVVGASIGAALTDSSQTNAGNLVRDADIALYRAKSEGRNTFRVFDVAMDEDRLRRKRIEADLGLAIARPGQLSVCYQPIYSGDGSVVTGAEALLRWHHPVMGEIPPVVFIPIAEESGLINQLGEWMLREVFAATRNWRLQSVAVNVSPLELRTPGYAERFLDIAKEADADLTRIEVEITENVLIQNAGPTMASLETLRSAGVRLTIDDFGTGYSSLHYLRSLTLHRVKIDRGFVSGLGDSAETGHIVEAIITLAHAMGLLVTAEGVESRRQLSELARMGCDQMQGFLLSLPLTVGAFEDLPGVVVTDAQALAG